MGAAFLITLREGVEAALVIGIILGVLVRLGQRHLTRYVWGGTLVAVSLSAVAGLILYMIGVSFSGRIEQLFEGSTMIAAALLLTWMIFWMKTRGRQLARHLEEETQEAIATGSLALFAVAFIAVLREGLETALFLVAATFQVNAWSTVTGGVLGLSAAILVGILLFRASQTINLRLFFNVTGLLLLLVAAGLVAHGVHEFQEAQILPIFIEHVWDTNAVLDESSTLGTFLKALFGYNGNPSLLEVFSYITYMLIVGIAGKPRDVKVRELLT